MRHRACFMKQAKTAGAHQDHPCVRSIQGIVLSCKESYRCRLGMPKVQGNEDLRLALMSDAWEIEAFATNPSCTSVTGMRNDVIVRRRLQRVSNSRLVELVRIRSPESVVRPPLLLLLVLELFRPSCAQNR
jgi:hypothetical protein